MTKAQKINDILIFLHDNKVDQKNYIDFYNELYKKGLLTYSEAAQAIYKNDLYDQIYSFYELFCTTGSPAAITEATKIIRKYNAV